MRDFAFGRWFTAVAVTASLCTAVIAAPTAKHAPAQATTAQKKDAPKKDPQKKDEPNISAPHAILIDADNGGVLFERDADRLIFPASLAKLMTAEYVFNEVKEGRLKLTDEFMVSENAWRKGGAPSHGSTMFAAIYSKVPVDDLIHAMIIQSANDACIILAEGIAGSEAAFAEKLTERARVIGLEKSVFTNSNGLPDAGEKVTTRELGLLARHIIRSYPDFYQIFGKPDYTWNKIRQQNRNPLLGAMTGADGLKTGFTKEAGYGLVGSAVQNGQRLIVVVNGVNTPRSELTKPRSCWSGASGTSSSVSCSQKDRQSERQRCLEAIPAAYHSLRRMARCGCFCRKRGARSSSRGSSTKARCWRRSRRAHPSAISRSGATTI